MSLLIPLQDDETELIVNRFAVLLACDVTRKMDAQAALLAADIKSGSGTVVIVDVISPVLDEAR